MSKPTRVFLASLLLSPLGLAACVDDPGPGDGDDAADMDVTDGSDVVDDTTDTGTDDSSVPLDSDEDGLTDEEEAMYGTDPLKKDTDGDRYWDSWEITEGTDPLDPDDRIYYGYWPYNPNKADVEQGSWGGAKKNVGTPFPAGTFLDQYGDMVDPYDFTNFDQTEWGEPAYFIFDLSAQWCGPCHNVADWIAGVDNGNTSWIQDSYPTVREKVHTVRIWWTTFVVQDANGQLPTQADVQTWFNQHHDPLIPLFVDAEQKVLNAYGSDSFPHFFLMTPELKLGYFPQPGESTNANPYPALGLVDTQLN